MSTPRPDGHATTASAPAASTSRFAAAIQHRPRVPMAEPVPDPVTLPRHITIVDGELLREARRRHHVSQETLAWDAGISITTIADLERRPPVPRRCRTRTLARLAAALGEPPAALVPPHMAAALGLIDSDDVPIADQPDQPAEPATGSGPGAMPA